MIPFPDKKYSVIYADPPWSYSGGGAKRNVTRHYHTCLLYTSTVTTKPDKTAIKKAIQAGEDVTGASLVENRNIQIKYCLLYTSSNRLL